MALALIPLVTHADHAGNHSGACFDSTASGPLAGKTIIVDPGHGGTDPGAVQHGLLEKDLNLVISRDYLTPRLRAQGARVCLTRTADETLSNNDRYTFANRNNGNALVSVHLNSSSNQNVDYTMTMFGKRNKDLAFAETILPYLVGELTEPGANDAGEPNPLTDGRVSNFASGVLLKSEMPAIIVEAVFMSHPWEAKALKGEDWNHVVSRQEQIARAIEAGVVAFFDQDGGGDPGDGDDSGGGGPGGGPPSNPGPPGR
jgi:N-acetylmuramoyl-L-alanine amidase